MSNIIQRLQTGNESRSVLIIDDDKELALSLSRILKMFFKECVLAKDGEEAFEIYKERIKSSKPFTLVVTDLELPKKGGLSLIKDIRSLVKFQPILIISAHDEAQFMSEAISLDVQGYLLKPLFMPKLFENLEKVLLHENVDEVVEQNVDKITGWRKIEELESFLDSSSTDNVILLRIKVNYLSNIYSLIGEEYADEYVKALASLLESLQTDAESTFYRMSLDELALILKNKELEYANKLVEEMISIARYFHISENGIIMNSTLSVGIAHGSSNLLKHSRLALEEATNNDISCVKSYTQSDYERNLNIINGREVMKMIYKAIETNTIIPYVQPIINVKTQETKIFNSYVRIMEEDKIYGPDCFLTIAQSAHQMSMITRTMIKNTLALSNKINQEDKILAIHLSNEDLFDETLLQYIIFWSTRYEIEPSNIGFEIFTTPPYLSSKKQYSLIKELKENGYKIILNNFGLDKYNLASILELKPEYIKIHTDIIKKLDEEPNCVDIIQKLTDIIHFIGSKAIATHISTTKQLNMIKSTDVDYIQGYKVCSPYEVK